MVLLSEGCLKHHVTNIPGTRLYNVPVFFLVFEISNFSTALYAFEQQN
jgi:hypothetical protein